MFCTNCGTKLNSTVKFCQNCGFKITNESIDSLDKPEVKSIAILPTPSKLPTAKVQLSSFEAEGPDEDRNFRVTVKYSVTNDSKEDWEFYETWTQLFNANGQIIEETRESREQTISKGETIELETYFWGIRSELFGTDAENSIVLLSFTASEFAHQKLGELKIPGNPSEMVPIKPTKIDNLLSLISGSIRKTEPDDDKDCRVEIKALIQNHTSMHLPEVKIVANISDVKGREVTDASCSEGIRPGALSVISGSGYTKEKKLIGASVDLALGAYWPVAVGVNQHQGMIISASEREEHDDQEDSEELPSNVVRTFEEESAESDDIQEYEDRFNLISATINLEKNISSDHELLALLNNKQFKLVLESGMCERDTCGFLVNIHANENNIQLSREDGKRIAILCAKYIYEYKDNNIHPSFHDDFDNHMNLKIYVGFNDEVIYIFNITGNLRANNTGNESKNSFLFEWSMNFGQVDMESIEDSNIATALEKVKTLVANGEHETALKFLPRLRFEFSGANLDSDPSEFFTEELDLNFEIDVDNDMHNISLEVDNDTLCISISVKFSLPVKADIEIDELNEWLDNNGGYFAGLAYGGWGWSGDQGGQLICVN